MTKPFKVNYTNVFVKLLLLFAINFLLFFYFEVDFLKFTIFVNCVSKYKTNVNKITMLVEVNPSFHYSALHLFITIPGLVKMFYLRQ